MEASPAPAVGAPPKGPRETTNLFTAWPKSAQWTAAALLAAIIGLLSYHAYAGMRFGTRASEHRDDGPIYRMDLNRAPAAELNQLPGIGTKLAERIVTYRITHGPFRSIDDLRQVSGIGPKTLERMRPWVCVEPGEAAAEAPVPKPSPLAKTTAPGKSKKEALLTGAPININLASQAELMRLPRIGPKLSERIIEERAKGPFKSVDELRRVKGIGPKTLANLRPFITAGEDPLEITSANKMP
jgi:competence protein ComEA